MAILREEMPYLPINFELKLGPDGETGAKGAASEINGLNIEVQTVEYRGGNAKTNYTKKLASLSKAGDITIKRGIIGAKNMYEWIDQVRTGQVDKAKRVVTITLSDENPTNDTPVITWKLLGAMPIKWNGPTLHASNTSDVGFEELVLSVDHLEQS